MREENVDTCGERMCVCVGVRFYFKTAVVNEPHFLEKKAKMLRRCIYFNVKKVTRCTVVQDVYRPLPGLGSCWGDCRLTVL